ncbi:MAG: ROK family protein [Phycisphaerales bacterium]|nr:ROK family protein [Planctomycetota bacterium]
MSTLGIDIGGTSIKAALAGPQGIVTQRSAEYALPTLEVLVAALKQAVPASRDPVEAIGLCVPGRLNAEGTKVEHSINVPALQALPLREILAAGLGASVGTKLRIESDAFASAYGHWERTGRRPGRLFAVALGTGVGACVLETGEPLRFTGGGAGHFGQIDVSLDSHAPAGRDGVRGSLEAYLGAQSLRQQLGDGFAARLGDLDSESVPLRALAKALHTAHALFRPDRIALLGFIGERLAPAAEQVRRAIERDLPSVARKSWTLEFAQSPFLAAIGVGLLAGKSDQAGVGR